MSSYEVILLPARSRTGMSEKQKLFCEYYLRNGRNATQAARDAGYSLHSAKRCGYDNLQKPYIRDYIQKRVEAIDAARIAETNEVLQYLTSVMRGESESEVVIVEGKGDGISRAVRLKKTPDEKERLKAAEQLGKRLGLWDGSGKQQQSNGILENLLALVEKQNAGD